jgi:cell wall-associated NlpC family hydrolase
VSEPHRGCLDTGYVSIGAVVQQAGEVLGRAHSLFGDPPTSGRPAARSAGSALTGAGTVLRGGLAQISGLSGEFSTGYAAFGARAAPGLDGLAGTDQRLGDHLHDAAGADRTGRATSGGVLSGAAADTSALAPYTTTPAGQKALITALRARVAHQQRVVAAYRARDARMAALLRSMAYSARAGGVGGGIPLAGGGLGARSNAGTGGGGPSSMDRRPHTMLASHIDWRADAVLGGPGGVAATAALSKQGTPYVWGAKGPDRFDCSGLTQWAWGQAGVHLGPDTYSQVIQGVPVAPGDVRAGDLIFPKDDFDSRGPGHVQLAISPTQVVHAPQTGDVVRIAPMPSAYVARRPVPVGDVGESSLY